MSKMGRIVSREAATAYLLAGRAVACYALAVKLKSASIAKVRGWAGHVSHHSKSRRHNREPSLSGRARLQIERLILINLAGIAAQRRFSKRSWRRYRGTRDFRLAADLAHRIDGDAAGATVFLKWLEFCASRFVNTRWDKIDRVARKLLERNTMSGEEIVEVIEGNRAIQRRQLRDLWNRLKATAVQRRHEMTKHLTPMLSPALAKLEHSMGIKSPDEKLRSRILSAVQREYTAFVAKHLPGGELPLSLIQVVGRPELVRSGRGTVRGIGQVALRG